MTTKKQRSDAWTEEMDSYLAETTLSFLREGKTAKEAFTVVGNEYDKTDSAVQFRWNNNVRDKYAKEVTEAKKQGVLVKKKKRQQKDVEAATIKQNTEQSTVQQETLDTVNLDSFSAGESNTEFMNIVLAHFEGVRALKDKYQDSTQELLTLREKVKDLTDELTTARNTIQELEKQPKQSEEDKQLLKENEELQLKNQELTSQVTSLEAQLSEFSSLADAIRKMGGFNAPSKDSNEDDDNDSDTVAS
ncbi:hypothetical protein U8V72_23375 [Priestia filamentosa]|uniref:hypothetical protein n=1 Tax=Priestia filamentosa TaxID=1402861 RepID=UPI0005894704